MMIYLGVIDLSDLRSYTQKLKEKNKEVDAKFKQWKENIKLENKFSNLKLYCDKLCDS